MRKKVSLHSSSESESMRDRWMISYADLVTLLLALFIVMYAASDRQRAKIIADSFSTQATGGNGVLPGGETVKDQARLLDNPILSERTKIKQTEKGLIVSLVEAGVFSPGEAAINPEAEVVITALAESLKDETTPIRVEGHTDSKPISTAKYSSNWELSTARAASVLQMLVEKGISPERLSAAGYGGFQPVADNETPEGRTQNRRVDVVILNR